MHYKDALWYGIKQVQERHVLITNLFISTMQIVKENNPGIRNVPGTQLKKNSTEKVIYTPSIINYSSAFTGSLESS